MDLEEIEAFLKDLAELTKRHKIVITGCGCCDSPSLDDLDGSFIDGNLRWQDRDGGYYDTSRLR